MFLINAAQYFQSPFFGVKVVEFLSMLFLNLRWVLIKKLILLFNYLLKERHPSHEDAPFDGIQF